MSEELKAALARIACLEGEIAKRDGELVACRIAVENCELFRARIAELENELSDIDFARRVSLQNESDLAETLNLLRAELAAIKAQEPVAWAGAIEYGVPLLMVEPQNWKATPLYAAPVSEAKAQGVVIPPSPYMHGSHPTDFTDYELGEIHGRIAMWEEVKRLNAAPAAPAAPAADAGVVAVGWAKDAEEWGPALNEAGWLFLSELNEDPQKSALIFNNTKGPLRAAIMKYAEIVASHRAKGVV